MKEVIFMLNSNYNTLKSIAKDETKKLGNTHFPSNSYKIADNLGISVRNEVSYKKDCGNIEAPFYENNTMLVQMGDEYIIYYYEHNPIKSFLIMSEVANYLLNYHSDVKALRIPSDNNNLLLLTCLLIVPPEYLIACKIFNYEIMSNKFRIPIKTARQYYNDLIENDEQYRQAQTQYKQQFVPCVLHKNEHNSELETPDAFTFHNDDNIKQKNDPEVIVNRIIQYRTPKKVKLIISFMTIFILIVTALNIYYISQSKYYTASVILNTSQTLYSKSYQTLHLVPQYTTEQTTETITQEKITQQTAVATNTDSDAPVSDTNIESRIVKVTKTGTKYHLSQCHYVKYKNNLREITIKDARTNGYTPCSSCLPDR